MARKRLLLPGKRRSRDQFFYVTRNPMPNLDPIEVYLDNSDERRQFLLFPPLDDETEEYRLLYRRAVTMKSLGWAEQHLFIGPKDRLCEDPKDAQEEQAEAPTKESAMPRAVPSPPLVKQSAMLNLSPLLLRCFAYSREPTALSYDVTYVCNSTAFLRIPISETNEESEVGGRPEPWSKPASHGSGCIDHRCHRLWSRALWSQACPGMLGGDTWGPEAPLQRKIASPAPVMVKVRALRGRFLPKVLGDLPSDTRPLVPCPLVEPLLVLIRRVPMR